MGDHRASIKIEMEFHGIEDECEMYISYFPGEYGIDVRIVEFIENVYERGMLKYNKEAEEYWWKENKEKIEEKEKVELKRLKEKYE